MSKERVRLVISKKDARLINTILLISLIAVLSLPLYVVYFLTPAFSEFLIDDTEKRLINVAERMADSLQYEGTITSHSITPRFIQELKSISSAIALPKIKIFAVDGTIVYCTDPADIGKKSSKNFFPEIVASGYPRTDIITKEMSGGSERKNPHKIIETYVPIINHDTFDVVGVFEIYYDITTSIKSLDKLTHRAYVMLFSIVLVLLGAVLLSVSRARINMRRREFAEQEIRRQKELLEHQHAELAEMHEQAKALSLQDHLTGLGNRRLLEIHFERAFALAHRYEKELALIMLDVDHFKAYNDKHGHQAGDMALVNLAATIGAQLRETDLAFRYGGEEFLLLLPEIGMETCLQVAEKLRLAVAEDTDVTVSMGVASYRPGSTIDGMIRQADKALYQAKLQGRNRVVCAQE
jgi:diguanylate cyclase (GGDEF)-like protein